jgi:hypothetical protein
MGHSVTFLFKQELFKNSDLDQYFVGSWLSQGSVIGGEPWKILRIIVRHLLIGLHSYLCLGAQQLNPNPWPHLLLSSHLFSMMFSVTSYNGGTSVLPTSVLPWCSPAFNCSALDYVSSFFGFLPSSTLASVRVLPATCTESSCISPPLHSLPGPTYSGGDLQ